MYTFTPLPSKRSVVQHCVWAALSHQSTLTSTTQSIVSPSRYFLLCGDNSPHLTSIFCLIVNKSASHTRWWLAGVINPDNDHVTNIIQIFTLLTFHTKKSLKYIVTNSLLWLTVVLASSMCQTVLTKAHGASTSVTVVAVPTVVLAS